MEQAQYNGGAIEGRLGWRLRLIPSEVNNVAGWLLHLDMVDPSDPRRAEIFLEPAELGALRTLVNGIADKPESGFKPIE